MSAAAAPRARLAAYAIEAWGLAVFMIAACGAAALLYHPASPAARFVPSGAAGRLPMGVAMALTAAGLIYSPWGRRSGAHFNPAVTFTHFRLGKVAGRDLLGYVVAHFVGAAAGVGLVAATAGALAAHPEVAYVRTTPGAAGPCAALVAEAALGFTTMSVVLGTSARPRLERFTGLFAAGLVALYITFEAPVSGMSLNPARSFGSALFAGAWDDFWVYLVGPVAGMLLAAEVRVRRGGGLGCAKMRHDPAHPCLFCGAAGAAAPEVPAAVCCPSPEVGAPR